MARNLRVLMHQPGNREGVIVADVQQSNGQEAEVIGDCSIAESADARRRETAYEHLQILIVEDDTVAAGSLALALRSLHPAWAIDLAGDLQSALVNVEDAAPAYDAAIVDLGLPDTATAAEAPVRLRHLDPALAVVVLTGNPSNVVADSLIRSGVQDFLLKGQATARQMAYSLRAAIRRQSVQSSLERAARRDCLTGTLNRAGLESEFPRLKRQADRTGTSCGLILCDLDRFKSVNDRYGHAAGDEVLRRFGNRICNELRPGDVVARVGGDEFVVLLDQVANIEQAVGTCTRLAASVAEDCRIGNTNCRATASYGLAMSPVHGTDLRGLMEKADSAMYDAKRRGITIAVAG